MKFVKILLNLIAVFLLCVVGFMIWGWWYVNPDVDRQNNIIYTQRNGQDLGYSILRPTDESDRNNIGIILMNSGSWKSDSDRDRLAVVAPLIRHGYTIFSLSHLSQPKASVMEIVEDINRAARHIRHHADKYDIDPDRIGVTGGSSGGHLSLMLATRGGSGPDDAGDPVDRESSAIQAAAIFFPVTDLLNLGDSTENLGDGGPPKSFVKAFGPHSTDPKVWKVTGRSMSPIYHVTPKLPPILIHHGDADTLVPLDQSQRFQTAAKKAGRPVTLVIRSDKKHGWVTMFIDIMQFATWFDENL